MQSQRKLIFVASLYLIFVTCLSKQCQKEEIEVNNNCIKCNTINNVDPEIFFDSNKMNQCKCKEGFEWSSKVQKCQLANSFQRMLSAKIQAKSDYHTYASNLACDNTKGFVSYLQTGNTFSQPQICLNCRSIPFGLTTINSTGCTCIPPFIFDYNFTSCICPRDYDSHSLYYYDPSKNDCVSCSQAGSLINQCKMCSAPFLTKTFYGCIYAPNLLNRGSTTVCAAGYIFNAILASCICDFKSGYAFNKNGECQKCPNTDCINCINSYGFDNYICKYGQLYSNYDYTSTFRCKTGTSFKLNPLNFQAIGCVCSFGLRYYQNGANCISCSTSLPTGIALADCNICALAKGFYKGSVECIYCPGVINAVGTATINGCNCNTNYYWNAISDQCECDFVFGFIPGDNNGCISCLSIPNTGNMVYPKYCSCLPGFKWDRVSRTCYCDTTLPSSFQVGSSCTNCLIIVGAIGTVGSNRVSCDCITGYAWNSNLNQCVCDYNQNYVVFNGMCSDCLQAPFSNGLANSQGCVCLNGLIWDNVKSKCVCALGNVMVGQTCTNCSTATLSGSTIADCTACNNSKGYALDTIGCFLCSSQAYANGAVNNNLCRCISTSLIWNAQLGSCVCDWGQKFTTYILAGGKFNCTQYLFVHSFDRSVYTCFNLLDTEKNICTYTENDIYYRFNLTRCIDGYIWSQSTYPYKCVVQNLYKKYYSAATNSHTVCSSTNSACSLCDLASGYLLLTAINVCLLCSTVSGSTGSAVLNGCVCSSGKAWNPVTLTCATVPCAPGMIYSIASNNCVCDPAKSIIVASNCIACSSISLSNGNAATSSSCACITPASWTSTITGGRCTNAACNLVTQIALANGNCFTCPTTANNGLGAASGSACKCNTNFVWSPTTVGGSCVCDLTKAYTIGSKCIVCPNNTQTTGTGDGKGGCICKSASSSWVASASAGSCQLCNTQANVVVLSNGSCFNCNSSKAYTLAKVVNTKNDSCTCTSTSLTWNSKGFCDCNTSSVMIITGNTFVCFPCSNASAFTSAKIDSFNCSCVSNNLKWNSTNKACGCSTANSVVRGSGSTASCFTCVVGGYIVGISADQTACLCMGDLFWIASTSSCGCPSNQIIVGSGADLKCISCSSIQYGNQAINATTCSCLGAGIIFSQTSVACYCPQGSIIRLDNFSCFPCPSGSSPLTRYECLCPTGSIWNYLSQNCQQCGTTTILNSLSSGGTMFSCVCSNGFIWDVMTQSCISSTACQRLSPSCMKCPSGTALTLNTVNIRNLRGGMLVQASINGSFTNYNQIKGYRCPCASGFSWDSLRLSCQRTGI